MKQAIQIDNPCYKNEEEHASIKSNLCSTGQGLKDMAIGESVTIRHISPSGSPAFPPTPKKIDRLEKVNKWYLVKIIHLHYWTSSVRNINAAKVVRVRKRPVKYSSRTRHLLSYFHHARNSCHPCPMSQIDKGLLSNPTLPVI